MPWHETDPVEERMKFVVACLQGEETVTALCARFGISRKTGYKFLRRYATEGKDALDDRCRAPRRHPNQAPPSVEAAVLRVRKEHPTWGSKKILAVLGRQRPEEDWPARSTIDAILKRAGVVHSRRRRRGRPPSAPPCVEAHEPNDVWSIDYKGWFRVGDGTRCDPLTVNDVCSRTSLVLEAMVSPRLEDVQGQLEEAFWQFGLPNYVLSDTGPPFGSIGLGHLSRLGVWLLRLGIRPVFIEPGRPDQNGRHERFHETLKAETASPPKATVRAQQAAFTRFQAIYNEERPHEALDMRVPAEVYELSPRPMVATPPDHEYGEGFEARRVRPDGSIKWAGRPVFIGEAMRGELLGLEPVHDGLCHVYLGPVRLGVLHERSKIVVPLPEDPAGVTHVPGHPQG